MSLVKKKFLECEIHGLTLFRCMRKCWKGTHGKPYASRYDEECFKCIGEGRYKTTKTIEKKTKHLRL